MKRFAAKAMGSSAPPGSSFGADGADDGKDPQVTAIKAKTKELVELRAGIKEWSQKCEGMIKSGHSHSGDGKKFANAALDLRGLVAPGGNQVAPLTAALAKVAALQQKYEDERLMHLNQLGESISASLMRHCREEIDAAKTAKEKYFDSARKAFNAADRNFNNVAAKGIDITKLNESRAERNARMEEYTQATSETTSNLDRVGDLGTLVLMDTVCTYIESLHTHHDRVMKLLTAAMADVQATRKEMQIRQQAFANDYDAEALHRMNTLVQSAGDKSLFSAAKKKVGQWKDGSASTSNAGSDRSNAPALVFGAPLPKLCSEGEAGIPAIARQCVAYLEKYAMDKEGVFRLSGSASAINDLKNVYEGGSVPDLEQVMDHNVVAGLFKLWLRELPEPLLTFDLYTAWLDAVTSGQGATALAAVAARLPAPNAQMLRFLCDFLRRVAALSATNKMASSNLSIVFSPNILYKKNQDPFDASDFQTVGMVVARLIDEFDTVFANNVGRYSPSAAAAAAAAVGGGGGGGLRNSPGSAISPRSANNSRGNSSRGSGIGSRTASASKLHTAKQPQPGSIAAALKGSQPSLPKRPVSGHYPPAQALSGDALVSPRGGGPGKTAQRVLPPICGSCNKGIETTGVAALGRKFHSECFKCAGPCGKPFAGRYFVKDGQPYCQKDYESKFGPVPQPLPTAQHAAAKKQPQPRPQPKPSSSPSKASAGPPGVNPSTGLKPQRNCATCNKPLGSQAQWAHGKGWCKFCWHCSRCNATAGEMFPSAAGPKFLVCANCK